MKMKVIIMKMKRCIITLVVTISSVITNPAKKIPEISLKNRLTRIGKVNILSRKYNLYWISRKNLSWRQILIAFWSKRMNPMKGYPQRRQKETEDPRITKPPKRRLVSHKIKTNNQNTPGKDNPRITREKRFVKEMIWWTRRKKKLDIIASWKITNRRKILAIRTRESISQGQWI